MSEWLNLLNLRECSLLRFKGVSHGAACMPVAPRLHLSYGSNAEGEKRAKTRPSVSA